MSDDTSLSEQAFEEWYNSMTKYSIRYDTALAGWQACARTIAGYEAIHMIRKGQAR